MHSGSQCKRWLLDHLRNCSPGAALPTDRSLADAFGISSRTVGRIMYELRNNGDVVRIRGKGTFAKGAQGLSGDTVPERPVRSVERLENALRESIMRGEIRAGDPLPQVKFLCLQYHVSEKTVTGAFRNLAKQSLAYKSGKRYWAGAPSVLSAPRVYKDVYIIAGASEDFEHIFTDDFMADAYQKFEREMRTSSMVVRYATLEQLRDLALRWRAADAIPAGVVFWKARGRDLLDHKYDISSLTRPSYGAPHTAVLVDLARIDDMAPAWQNVNVISRGNISTAQARSVAEYLCSIGCAHLALVFEGDAVRADPRSGFLRYHKVIFETLIRSRGAMTVSQNIIQKEFRITADWIRNTALNADPGYIEYLHGKYADARAFVPEDFDRAIGIVEDCGILVGRLPRHSVAVCTTDALADALLSACGRAGKKTPRDFSILSLENNPRLYHRGITACAPDWDQIGYLMAHAIKGDIPLRKTHRGFIRPPAPIIQRLTSPRAKTV